MGENFEKTMAILNGSKTLAAVAIKTMALDLDKKFEELDKKNEERHQALIDAIKSNKTDTDKKFEKLRVVMFFSENPKWLYMSLIGVTAMLIIFGFTDLIKLIK